MSLVVGGGNGVGRETALLAARRGAHVVVADKDFDAAKLVADEVRKVGGKETTVAVAIDIRDRDARFAPLCAKRWPAYGGVDIVVNTAAIFPSSPDGTISDAQWGLTLDINVTANHRLMEEVAQILREQDLDASIVLTSSANAVVPKKGSEAYDVSKAAVSHLVREFAISCAPKDSRQRHQPRDGRKGSTMFPRDRVIASLNKYGIAHQAAATDEQLALHSSRISMPSAR